MRLLLAIALLAACNRDTGARRTRPDAQSIACDNGLQLEPPRGFELVHAEQILVGKAPGCSGKWRNADRAVSLELLAALQYDPRGSPWPNGMQPAVEVLAEKYGGLRSEHGLFCRTSHHFGRICTEPDADSTDRNKRLRRVVALDLAPRVIRIATFAAEPGSEGLTGEDAEFWSKETLATAH
jgi:hypothetical protein